MKKHLAKLIIVALFGVAFYYYYDAFKNQPKITSVSCNKLSGTWEGRYIEKSGPYAGEVDVKLMLYINKIGKVVGKILPLRGKVNFANEKIRGICKKGKLQLYFFSNYPAQVCGVLSHAKVLDGRNIDLYLRWESAMTGGHGDCPLYKVSNRYDHGLIRKINDFDFANTSVATCH